VIVEKKRKIIKKEVGWIQGDCKKIREKFISNLINMINKKVVNNLI